MAAYGIASPVFVLFSAVSNIFSSGTQTVCARSLGKGDVERAGKCFTATIIMIVMLSVLLIPVLFCAGDSFAVLLGVSGKNQNLVPLVSDL